MPHSDEEEQAEDLLRETTASGYSPAMPAPGSSSHVSSATRSVANSHPTGPPSSSTSTSTATAIGNNSPSNVELMRVCHEFLEQLKEGTPWVVQHLDRNYVPMPTDPAQFSFWMALVRFS